MTPDERKMYVNLPAALRRTFALWKQLTPSSRISAPDCKRITQATPFDQQLKVFKSVLESKAYLHSTGSARDFDETLLDGMLLPTKKGLVNLDGAPNPPLNPHLTTPTGVPGAEYEPFSQFLKTLANSTIPTDLIADAANAATGNRAFGYYDGGAGGSLDGASDAKTVQGTGAVSGKGEGKGEGQLTGYPVWAPPGGFNGSGNR
jgi:hypothetical protein